MERQNEFKLYVENGTISRKPDIVALRDDEAVIVDAKAAKPNPSHEIQVMLYMIWLPLVNPKFQQAKLSREVYYGEDNVIDIPAATVGDRFRAITARPGGPGSCPRALSPRPGRNRTASWWSTPWLEYLKYSFLPGINKPGLPATPSATDGANLQPWLETGLFPATPFLNSGHHGTCGCVGIAQDFWWPAPSNRGDKWSWTGLTSVHDNYWCRMFTNSGAHQQAVGFPPTDRAGVLWTFFPAHIRWGIPSVRQRVRGAG